MKNFRVISRLEVKSDYVIKGIRMEGLKKINSPLKIIENFADNFVDEIFYEDVVASLYNRSVDYNIIKDLSKIINIPLCVSGRVRSISDFYKLFDMGADKISLNTSVFGNPSILNKAAKIFGSQSICSHIQYKKVFNENDCPEVFSESGRERKFKNLFDWIRVVQDNGAGEIYLFSIDNDGIDFEIDYEILSRTREIVKVPLIYGGGINNIEKIKKLIDIGFDGITISTAIYDKSLDLIDIKKKLSKIYKKINFNTNDKHN